jgi:hypothetical protein
MPDPHVPSIPSDRLLLALLQALTRLEMDQERIPVQYRSTATIAIRLCATALAMEALRAHFEMHRIQVRAEPIEAACRDILYDAGWRDFDPTAGPEWLRAEWAEIYGLPMDQRRIAVLRRAMDEADWSSEDFAVVLAEAGIRFDVLEVKRA